MDDSMRPRGGGMEPKNPQRTTSNRNLSKKFKEEAQEVFTEYKDVFALDHEELKGVGP